MGGREGETRRKYRKEIGCEFRGNEAGRTKENKKFEAVQRIREEGRLGTKGK
jgi:hypothetical protein